LRLFRYPAESELGVARAAEIYQRTLELVEAKAKEAGFKAKLVQNVDF